MYYKLEKFVRIGIHVNNSSINEDNYIITVTAI